MEFTQDHRLCMQLGLELYNQELYWECHEDLEHHWLEDRHDPCRYVYWTIIQVAAALLHFKKQNIKGATGLIVKAQEKFIKCQEFKFDESPYLIALNWNSWHELVIPLNSSSQLSDFQELYMFKFPIN